MEPEGPFPRTYNAPDQSNPSYHPMSWRFIFIIAPSIPRVSKLSLSFIRASRLLIELFLIVYVPICVNSTDHGAPLCAALCISCYLILLRFKYLSVSHCSDVCLLSVNCMMLNNIKYNFNRLIIVGYPSSVMWKLVVS